MEHVSAISEGQITKIYPNSFLNRFITKKNDNTVSKPIVSEDDQMKQTKPSTIKRIYQLRTPNGIEEKRHRYQAIDFNQFYLFTCTGRYTEREKYYNSKAKENIKQITEKKKQNNILQKEHHQEYNHSKNHKVMKTQHPYYDYTKLNKKTIKKQSHSYKFICRNLKKEARDNDMKYTCSKREMNKTNLDSSKSKITTSKRTITIQKKDNRLPLGREKYFNVDTLKKIMNITTETTPSIKYDTKNNNTPNSHIKLFDINQVHSLTEQKPKEDTKEEKKVEYVKNRYKQIVELYEHNPL